MGTAPAPWALLLFPSLLFALHPLPLGEGRGEGPPEGRDLPAGAATRAGPAPGDAHRARAGRQHGGARMGAVLEDDVLLEGVDVGHRRPGIGGIADEHHRPPLVLQDDARQALHDRRDVEAGRVEDGEVGPGVDAAQGRDRPGPRGVQRDFDSAVQRMVRRHLEGRHLEVGIGVVLSVHTQIGDLWVTEPWKSRGEVPGSQSAIGAGWTGISEERGQVTLFT
jgi:hypothetical protein